MLPVGSLSPHPDQPRRHFEEAALDELARDEIEFAQLDRVFATLGKLDEAQALIGLEAGRALPHPFLALGLGQRVEIEQCRPGRRGGGIIRLARRAPDALRMIGVAPEIEDAPVGLLGHRDAILGRGDRERLVIIGLVARIALEPRERARILILDPGERLRAVLVLEPDIGVVVGHRFRLRDHRARGKRGETE